MKKFLIAMGGIFGVVILLAIIGIVTIAIKGSALDKESKAYVDEVAPIILADLRQETLLKYASDDLKSAAKPEDLNKVFNWFKKLGKFQKYSESTGQANISITTQSGKVITGHYLAQAKFETGPAQVRIVTVKKGDQWFVQLFKIDSMALLEEKDSQQSGAAYDAQGAPSADP